MVAMSYIFHAFASVLGICLAFFPADIFQTKPTPTIIPKVGDISIKVSSPLSGQALQGNVSVQGETNVEGFSHGELSFAYQNNPTDTWFFIQSTEAPAKGELFRWDTTAITDGNYQLRLVVTLKDGRQSTVIIPNLRVRNYSPIETDTPPPAQSEAEIIAQGTPSPIARVKRSTPTPLPANPLSLSQQDIYKFFTQGAIAAMIIVIVITLVNAMKNSQKNR
jgi:hypothetical protein